jgi:methyl-accepting chemotaxis protein
LAASILYFKLHISRPLATAMRHFDAMAQGNLNSEVDITRRGDMGALLASLDYMQAHFRVITDEIRVAAERISRQTAAALAEVERVSGQSLQQSERVSEVSAAMERSRPSQQPGSSLVFCLPMARLISLSAPMCAGL